MADEVEIEIDFNNLKVIPFRRANTKPVTTHGRHPNN
jgi:hypothetical protein